MNLTDKYLTYREYAMKAKDIIIGQKLKIVDTDPMCDEGDMYPIGTIVEIIEIVHEQCNCKVVHNDCVPGTYEKAFLFNTINYEQDNQKMRACCYYKFNVI